MHEILSAEAAANLHYPSTQAPKEYALLPIMRLYLQRKEELPRSKQSHMYEQLVQQEKAFPTSPSLEQTPQLSWQL
jgi:hypothetical protein